MKYLHYTTYIAGQTGLSNTMMSIEVAVIMAFLTNRVLILNGNTPPPANVVEYEDGITNQYRSKITDLVELPVPWMEAEQIDIRGYDSHELTDMSLGDSVYYYPPDLDTSTDDFKAFSHQRTSFLSDTATCQRATVLKMSGGLKERYPFHNLTFYSSFFYLAPPIRRAVHRMLRLMQPKIHFKNFVDRIVKDLGAFNAVHFRRGDFKLTFGTTTLVRTPQEAIDALKAHFDTGDLLVIVTDEADDPFFHEIVKTYRNHVFIDHFILEKYRKEFLDLPHHDSTALAFLSQLVAAESQDFIGTMTSTFTSMIQRYRGNRGKPESFKFLWNELPDPADKVERGSHPVSLCIPMNNGIMVEEHPGPYSWNRFNSRINRAWQREWPESFLTDIGADNSANGNGHVAVSPLVHPTTLYVEFGAHQVAIETEEPAVIDGVQAHFRAMLVPAPQHIIGCLKIVNEFGQYRLLIKDKTCAEARGYHDFHPLLTREIVRQFIQNRTDLVWLHAGAVAKAGRSVVLAASWGSGKSTLSMQLHKQGWTYLSDDIVPLDPVTGVVHPFPQTPRVRQVADTIFSRDQLGELPKYAVDLDPHTVCRNAMPIGILVLPHFSPEAKTELVPHPPGTAVAELLESCLSFVEHREAAVQALCDLVQQRPTLRLSYNNSQDAANLIINAHEHPFIEV